MTTDVKCSVDICRFRMQGPKAHVLPVTTPGSGRACRRLMNRAFTSQQSTNTRSSRTLDYGRSIDTTFTLLLSAFQLMTWTRHAIIESRPFLQHQNTRFILIRHYVHQTIQRLRYGCGGPSQSLSKLADSNRGPEHIRTMARASSKACSFALLCRLPGLQLRQKN